MVNLVVADCTSCSWKSNGEESQEEEERKDTG